MNKNIFSLSIAMVMSSCNMIESLTDRDILHFDGHNFPYNGRQIMRNTMYH